MLKVFEIIGRYFMLMGKVFSRPEKAAIYRRRIVFEMEALGVNSIGLTAIISVFIGAVITLQMCINLDSPFIPRSLVGYATRETMILEFSSAVVALILAGKVGSSIASEIGTMRITEQIDALEIMGVNSASYLILPKIVAAMLFFPFLTILSILIGILGGWIIAAATGIMIPADYVDGLLMDFKPYSITYTLIKTVVFAYIITSISAFYGYNARGNSLEVGAASTPPRRGKRSFRWRPCAWRDASRFAAGNNGHTWWTRTYMITRAGQIANNTNRSVLYKSTQKRLEVMQLPTAFLHFAIFRMFEFSL